MKPLTLLSNEKIIAKANLPEFPVKKMLINRTIDKEGINELINRGIEPIFIKPNTFLPPYLKEHPDLNFFHYEYNKAYCDSYNSEGELKRFFNFETPKGDFGYDYPADCLLNCVRLDKYLICNKKSTDINIINQAQNDGINLIYVNQGYIKCSICVVDDKSIITDDISIYNQFKNSSIECLFIEKNSIKLKNYNYGFIGGCTGKIDKNKILFNGSVMSHTNCNSIIDFLSERNIEIIELNNDILTDVGSFIPLTEIIT